MLNTQFKKYKTLRFSLKTHEPVQFLISSIFIPGAMRRILHYNLNMSFFIIS
jgi:hypothetical protein